MEQKRGRFLSCAGSIGADAVLSAILGRVEKDKLEDAIDDLQSGLYDFELVSADKLCPQDRMSPWTSCPRTFCPPSGEMVSQLFTRTHITCSP